MPSAEQILEELTRVANQWTWLAIVWHAYFGLIVGALLLRWRPGRFLMGVLLALPVLSVGVVAFASGNPFNGVIFTAAGLTLAALVLRLEPIQVCFGSPAVVVTGCLLIALGWVYPHFLKAESIWAYFYASPTGLIPCPTLLILSGFALVLGGLSSRSWTLILASIGTFYGLVGAVRLGVALDWALVAGSVVLAITPFRRASA
ncbi:MAG TPA: hypothetical protein PLL78_00015 [Fimbriimonadaceae bacterium]|nr:hypothetical protein [Fimbriimonadaceae bacterium]HRJ95045.1 hypothetical protein [Fimbriimonadaceae bacterium]